MLVNTLFNPYPNPSTTCLGFSVTSFLYLELINYSSFIKVSRPLDIELAILLVVPKAPWTECFIKLPVPFNIPNPPYNGPLTNPYAGLKKKSLNPVPIELNKFIGFPRISILPIMKKIFRKNLCLYSSYISCKISGVLPKTLFVSIWFKRIEAF